jgi:hypothetical protein
VCEHPGDNALVFLVPASGTGAAAKPYVKSVSKSSWSIYRDLPILSMAVWNGVAYFGTPDGRIAKVGGYSDGALFGIPNSYSTIDWSLLTGFTDQGTLTLKRVEMMQPLIETQEVSPPVNAEAKYGLDISEAAPPTAANTASGSTWDGAAWDSAVWGGGYSEYTPIIGGFGMGRTVAIAVRGRATARTSFLGVGVMYRAGGLL